MEDEDEDFDKDDKVIMSCVRDALTHKHIHKRMRSHTYTHTHVASGGVDTTTYTGNTNRRKK